ncbi:MAG: CsbD family protein [Dehalococcoidia bacterium]|nr:CsbD family protein [Dehalococcoidia bacterium]
MVVNEKVKGRAEQLQGKVEQAVGKATGSEETQARGIVHEAEGKAREKVADAKGKAKRLLGIDMTGINRGSIFVSAVGAVIMIVIFRVLAPGRRQAA